MTDLLVDIQRIKKTFGQITAVDDISIELHAGDLLGLTGPDGAGKTTLMRLMAGVMTPDSGQVLINGFNMELDPDQAREHLGYLSQSFSHTLLHLDLYRGQLLGRLFSVLMCSLLQ